MSNTRSNDRVRARLQSALKGVFVLESELSGGGINRVFVGTETALGRKVVLKVLAPDAANEEQVARFRREAILAARLLHPHIVPVFAVGTVAGFLYYSMPFIDGESLRVRLDRGRGLPTEAAIRVLREIARALAFAHTHGVIHRDVKPENIVLEHGSGRALLADFGIACALGQHDEITEVGTTVGTPVYMSPEQVDGLELDGRSDIYSLGLVAWEMLTGERPWTGESLYAVMHRQKTETLPPLSDYGITVPAAVVTVIERALIKDREARWPSASALLVALGEKPELEESDSRDTEFGAAKDEPLAKKKDVGKRSQRAVSTSGGVEAGDPALTPTVAMSVPRAARGAASARDRVTSADGRDAPRLRTPGNGAAYDWQSARDRRVHDRGREPGRLRWIVAACGAALVTGSIVGAATLGHSVVRWTLASGEPADNAVATPSPDLQVDTLPARVAAAELASVHAVAPIGGPNDTSPSAPSVRTTSNPRSPGQRLTPVSLSHTDSVRGRAATATLALQSYQSIVGNQRVTQSVAPVAPPAAVHNSDGRDPNSQPPTAAPPAPSLATPRVDSAPSAGDARAPSPLDQGDSRLAPQPAAAVRVVPRTQPVVPTPDAPALPVRVRHPTDSSAGAPSAPAVCEPVFRGSRVCRVFDPATGRIETWYKPGS